MSDLVEPRSAPNDGERVSGVAKTPLVFRARRGGVRLDRVLADAVACSRRQARALIRSGRVRLNGRLVRGSPPVSWGDEVCIAAAPTRAASAPTPAPGHAYRVLWCGEEFWVLDKPSGVHTHAGRSSMSVAAALTRDHPEFRNAATANVEAGIVHRLDRDTSGILLAALDPAAYADLRARFAARAVTKQYWAIVTGRVEAMLIDRPLARRATRVVPARRGDRAYPAVTKVTPLEATTEWSLVEVEMRTGVTHQVRAHLAYAGHPLVGDAKYGGPAAPAGTREGQLLHARSIVLSDGRAFSAAAPDDFVRALYRLRRCGLGA